MDEPLLPDVHPDMADLCTCCLEEDEVTPAQPGSPVYPFVAWLPCQPVLLHRAMWKSGHLTERPARETRTVEATPRRFASVAVSRSHLTFCSLDQMMLRVSYSRECVAGGRGK